MQITQVRPASRLDSAHVSGLRSLGFQDEGLRFRVYSQGLGPKFHVQGLGLKAWVQVYGSVKV